MVATQLGSSNIEIIEFVTMATKFNERIGLMLAGYTITDPRSFSHSRPTDQGFQ